MQKRVDNTGRSVVECSIDIAIDEVCVPIKMLRKLSVPTKVSEQNMQLLQQLVNSGPVYPGANRIRRFNKGKLEEYSVRGLKYYQDMEKQ